MPKTPKTLVGEALERDEVVAGLTSILLPLERRCIFSNWVYVLAFFRGLTASYSSGHFTGSLCYAAINIQSAIGLDRLRVRVIRFSIATYINDSDAAVLLPGIAESGCDLKIP